MIFAFSMHNTYHFSGSSPGPPAPECFPCCRRSSSWEPRRWYRSQRGEVCNTNHWRWRIPSEESSRPQSSWRCWISAKCGLDHWHQSIGAQAPGWKGSRQSTLKKVMILEMHCNFRLHQDYKENLLKNLTQGRQPVCWRCRPLASKIWKSGVCLQHRQFFQAWRRSRMSWNSRLLGHCSGKFL